MIDFLQAHLQLRNCLSELVFNEVSHLFDFLHFLCFDCVFALKELKKEVGVLRGPTPDLFNDFIEEKLKCFAHDFASVT